MKLFRLFLAIVLALMLGVAPVLAGVHNQSSAAMQDCMGKPKGSCSCDSGSAHCGTISCKVACNGILGLVPAAVPTAPVRLAVAIAATVSDPQSIRPWSDTPVPRS